MKFPYELKLDINKKNYIEIPFSYGKSDIEIRIYKEQILVKGIDEQILFFFDDVIDFKHPNITFKTSKNYIDLFLEKEEIYLNINIKHVKNRLFFKLYKNELLFKRAFCYINKENKKIYQNSAHIVLKHLFNHKDVKKYNVIKKSNEEIYIDNEKTNEKFLISIFNENIIKMRYSIDGEETILYKIQKTHYII